MQVQTEKGFLFGQQQHKQTKVILSFVMDYYSILTNNSDQTYRNSGKKEAQI